MSYGYEEIDTPYSENKLDRFVYKFVRKYNSKNTPFIHYLIVFMPILNIVNGLVPLLFYLDHIKKNKEIYQRCDQPMYESICCDHADPIGTNLTNLIYNFGILLIIFLPINIICQFYRCFNKNAKIKFSAFLISFFNFLFYLVYPILLLVVLFRSNYDCFKLQNNMPDYISDKRAFPSTIAATYLLISSLMFDILILWMIKRVINSKEI